MKKYNLIVCGGTFDHFHKGHESLLRLAFGLGKKVVVGVTSDEFVRRLKIEGRNWKQIETFEKRRQAVLEFVKNEKGLDRVEIVKIENLFGPTLAKDLLIEAIVVSRDTKKNASIINQKRNELGLVPLKIFVAPEVLAEDGELISSARIRRGAINREGKLYVKPTWLKTDLVLPENLRQELKEPFGEMLVNIEGLSNNKNSLTITVGDITAKIFNEKSLDQKLSIIDFKVARKKEFANIKDLGFVGNEAIFNVNNPAGSITASLFGKLAEIFKSDLVGKIILEINGEDDLAVLPLILTVPLNTIIYYGQPGQGLVKVLVSESVKQIAYGLVDRFEKN